MSLSVISFSTEAVSVLSAMYGEYVKMFREINCSWLVTLVAGWCWSVKWPASAMISKDLEH